MALQQIAEGITGQVAADIIYNNDLENQAIAEDAQTKANAAVKTTDFKLTTAGKNLFNKDAPLNAGYIDPSTGVVTPNSLYKYTDPIPVINNLITVSGLGNIHYALGWRFNKADGSLAMRGASAADALEFTADGSKLTDVVSFQLTLKTSKPGDNTNLAAVQIEKGPKTDYEAYIAGVYEITPYPIVAKLAETSTDKSSPVTVDYFEKKGVTKASIVAGPAGKNIFNKDAPTHSGYIDPATGAYMPNAAYRYSDPMPIPSIGLLTISGMGTSHHQIGWRFNKADGTVARNGQSAVDATVFTADSGGLTDVVSFQMTLKTSKATDNTDLAAIQVERGVQTAFEPYIPGIISIDGKIIPKPPTGGLVNPLKGKKMLVFGDSITATNDRTNWPTFLAGILEMTIINYAFSGASFRNWGTTIPRQQLPQQIADAIADNLTDIAVVVVSIGTNDYGSQSLLGTYDATMAVENIEDLDKTHILDAARYAFWQIGISWPNAKCFYANPLQRANVAGFGTEADDNGGWLRTPVERLGRRYCFNIIDAYGQSGIIKDFEVVGGPGRYLVDGLHPGTPGKMLQGAFMANKILQEFI